LEKKLLVKGREVSRYHADSDSESEKEDEEEEVDDEDEEESDAERSVILHKNCLQPISVADDEWTPRFAKCRNCHEEFDVTQNDERGSCYWHKD
jgi:hypothetical protein